MKDWTNFMNIIVSINNELALFLTIGERHDQSQSSSLSDYHQIRRIPRYTLYAFPQFFFENVFSVWKTAMNRSSEEVRDKKLRHQHQIRFAITIRYRNKILRKSHPHSCQASWRKFRCLTP